MLVSPWHSPSSVGQMMVSCSQLISFAPCYDLKPSLSHTEVFGEVVTLQHFSSLLGVLFFLFSPVTHLPSVKTQTISIREQHPLLW